MIKTGHVLLVGGALAAIAGSASAQTFLAVRGTDLFRYDGSLEAFSLGDELHSLSVTSQGIIGVSSTVENFGDPAPELRNVYRLDDALGAAPFLTNLGVTEDLPVPTIFERNNGDLIGLGMGMLFVFNPDFSIATSIAVSVPGLGGTAYDPLTDTLFGTEQDTDTLVEIDIDTGVVTTIGSLGFDAGNQGGEWYNGTYYTAIEDFDQGLLLLGSIDVGTGAFTQIAVLDNQVGLFAGTIGLAVVPSSATLAPLALAGIFAGRRRR